MKINQTAASASASQPRPIHIYLLKYLDKGQILKAATNTLKDNPYCSDVSKSV